MCAKGKSKTKKVLAIVGIVLAAIVVALAIVLSRLGTIIKSSVNQLGPTVLGVPCQLESCSVYPLKGEIEMKHLEVGNPEGYSTPYLFHLDGMNFKMSIWEIFKGAVHINEIRVIGPHVWYHKTLTSSNLSDLLKILEGKYPKNEETKAEKSEKPEGGKKTVVIDHILVDEGTIGLKFGVGGEIPLMKIELHDVGKDGALMPVQIVKMLVEAVVSSVISAVGNVGGAAIDGASAVGGAAVDAASAVGGAAVDAASAVGGAVVGGASKVIGGIGSLFGSSDKAEEANSGQEATEDKSAEEEAKYWNADAGDTSYS